MITVEESKGIEMEVEYVDGMAFDRGYTPASVLPDIATVYQTSTGPPGVA